VKCLECETELDTLDAAHLSACCGLTVQEYALRHGFPLEMLVSQDACDRVEDEADWPASPHQGSRTALITWSALQTAGSVREGGGWQWIPGEIRMLDSLLWLQEQLHSLGFDFRQEYTTAGNSHRIVARNCLKRPPEKTPEVAFADMSEVERRDYAAIVLARAALRRDEYVFIQAPKSENLESLCQWLMSALDIDISHLNALDERHYVRTTSPDDTRRLIEGLLPQLRQIPGQEERLYEEGMRATIVKEQGIDAAHFITDHPGACANLHGGHYSVHFKIHDRIDPSTGFVMDYADLKRIVKSRIIEVLDHHTLNYAAPELTWRSSTEFLAIWMWERLIDYLPSLRELEIHETQTSYCQYRGPTLEEYRKVGPQSLLRHFQDTDLGIHRKREGKAPPLRVINQSE